MTLIRGSTLFLICALIAGAGFAAGLWNAARARAAFAQALIDTAEQCALAFRAEEVRALSGAPAESGNMAYLAVKSHLAQLRQARPQIRFAGIYRHLPDSRKVILLADSGPADSSHPTNPGDGSRDFVERAPGLQSLLQGSKTAFDGPSADPAGARVSGYALIETPSAANAPAQPRDILQLDRSAEDWRRAQRMACLQGAALTWALLGLSFVAILALRYTRQQSDLVRMLTQAFEQGHFGLVILDGDHRIEHVNAGLCSITGWQRKELIGQPVHLLISDETSRKQQEEIFAMIVGGRAWRGEIFCRRRDGSSYRAHSAVSSLYGGRGQQARTVIIIDDISEHKEVEATLTYAKERAEAGDRAKGQFLAMMSHEIRTPLNGIIGFASLTLDSMLTPEQREYIQTIRTSGEALLQLTNDLLDFSKIEAGRLHLDPRPCDPRECIESAFELLASRAAEKNLDLLHQIDRQVPAVVLIDADRLRQVLINLVGNAIKFTAAGEIEVALRAEPRFSPPVDPHGTESAPISQSSVRWWRLIFTVRDTGIGIAPGEEDKLFKPFGQINVSSTRKHSGAGLGLVISRGLARLMSGDITVEGAVDQGAVFTLAVAAEEALASVDDSIEPPDKSVFAGRTIAVAGPSPSLRRELSRLVQSWGGRVLECAREQLGAELWDVAMVDLTPAEAESWREVFARRPDFSSRLLVALVPVNFPSAGYDVLRPYFRAFVRKPPRHQALHALLASILQPEETAPLPLVPGTASPFGSALGLRVLLVEDNPVNQRLAQKILENLGCHWDLAEDGGLALERLRRGAYDLVLLDLNMPGSDDLTLAKSIRRGGAGESNRSIWITALTTDAWGLTRGWDATGTIDDYVVKPFKPADLATALKRMGRSRGGA